MGKDSQSDDKREPTTLELKMSDLFLWLSQCKGLSPEARVFDFSEYERVSIDGGTYRIVMHSDGHIDLHGCHLADERADPIGGAVVKPNPRH